MKATAKPKELCQDTDATLSTGCIDPFTAKWIEEQQSIQAYEPINEMIELE